MLDRWHGFSDQKTFAEIAESILSMAFNEGASRDRIDVVFDDYRDGSIKSVEREYRTIYFK